MSEDLVSIIVPIHNAEKYLSQSIESVFDQSHRNWELLLINDGSLDGSADIVRSYIDPRIKYFEQANKGVSAARNVGLNNMNGDFFCFLDADDVLPGDSLVSRLKLFFKKADLSFVDGKVLQWNESMTSVIGEWVPSQSGNPLHDLVSLSGDSFFGPSWMIRRDKTRTYKLDDKLTHGEDLFFYMQLARSDKVTYSYTNEEILHYRIHDQSAMRKNLSKLEAGYRHIYEQLRHWPEVSPEHLSRYISKVRAIMFKSYLRKGEFFNAIRVLR